MSTERGRFEFKGKPKKKQAFTYVGGRKSYPRDRETALNALSHANYLCEINSNHPVFLRKRSSTNYTEPHHLIPMAFSDMFDVSLDVEENIVSLCSNCHNNIHYGQDADVLLKELYDSRKYDLEKVEISITYKALLKMYNL
jgi:predicted HNH restriction endonuclease